jgi:ATP-binding cassette, subfamily B, bacterial
MTPNETIKKKIRRVMRLDLALRFIWQSTPGWTIASLLLMVVQGPLPLVSLYLMKLMVDEVTTGTSAASPEETFSQVAVIILLMAGMALFSAVLGLISGLVSQAQSLVMTDYMQEIIHTKSVEVDLEYYENAEYYDTLRRAQGQAPGRPLKILNGLLQLGRGGISLLAIAGLLLAFHWGIAVVLFVTVLPGFLVRLRYSSIQYEWQRRHTSTERKTWYFNWLLTGDSHAKEVRLFGLGPLFMERYRDLRVLLRREKLQIATRQASMQLVARIATMLGIYGSYAFIAYRALQGTITLGDLVMYYQAFQRGQGFLQDVLGSLAGLYEDNLFLTDLYEFLDLKPKVVEPTQPKPVPRPIQSGIVFDHVAFRYPAGTRQVLEDVSLTIRPGEKIALVGENGSGKTTLIKLLCRLYDPTGGTVTVDGVDLREFKTAALRQEIGVILQDYAHYNLTAQENIWFGNVEAPLDHGRVATVAQRSGAHEVISGLPDGYATILGKLFQDGEELSIGEWQKVALARAFLRNAQLIILDEPTSAMDAKAEYEVFEKLHQLAEGRSVILISHRFSTVRMADRIYVLEDGRIVESGTHDELIRYDGTYAQLFNRQAQQYI